MKMMQMVLCGGVMLAVGGCASDFVSDPNRARPTRAVESPGERNSASGEMANLADMSGVPLVEVGVPNHSGETPVVRTIADNILTPPTTTRPPVITGTPPVNVTIGTPTATRAAEPATRPGVRVDPLLGPRE